MLYLGGPNQLQQVGDVDCERKVAEPPPDSDRQAGGFGAGRCECGGLFVKLMNLNMANSGS